jgi:hypothetical protein
MFRAFAIFVATLVSVAAFAPVSRVARSSALTMQWKANEKFANEIGVQAPLGLFDPLNLLENADEVFEFFLMFLFDDCTVMFIILLFL